MSSAAAWANTLPLTLWRAGQKDGYGRFDYDAPVVVLCTYKVGGSERYTDAKGVEFTPASIFYTEMKTVTGEYLSSPKYGDKVLLGEYLGQPPAEAEDLRMITIYDAQMFGESEQPDYMLGV